MNVSKTILCLIFSLMVAFAGNEANAQKVIYSPVWTAQTQFAGYYAARDNGFFKDVGLDIDIVYPDLSKPLEEMLVKKKTDFMTLTLLQALEARSKGVKLVNVMQTSHNNALCIVSRLPMKNGIQSLSGKDIGCWYSFDEGIITLINQMLKKKPNWVKTNSGMNLFLSGATDYCFCCTYNEVFELKERGFIVKKDLILNMSDCGYNIPQEGVYVTEQFYNTHKKEVAQFVKAMTKGWIWVRNNREAALDITMKEVKKHNIGTSRYHQRCMLDEILRLQSINGKVANSFVLSKGEFERAIKLYASMGYKFKEPLVYNRFVK